ncbi:hypothetical protein QN277_018284 [Acacia crassicarpa]|uniref:DUF3741 domain-containing protein n=1 Tax=Acacia crassicarpa TaxID=499986 RepID=A0AAE1JR64_9FABA|nr:hypothetical protein QN277_018284 [Acacia crassicarpa]
MNLFPTRSSSSSSSTSSSSLSFDPTMCSSKKATEGCLTGILRRILCSRGLPTHPSDQIRDADSVLQTKEHDEFKADYHKTQVGSLTPTSTNATTVSAPGIVARLMGLDSMVEIPTESSAASLSRSRSMNSVQCFGECDRLQGIHRRVKSTLSFREVPGFTFLENDENFFVLSFGDEEFESKLGSERLKQRPTLKENRREKMYSENIMSGKEKQSRKSDGKLREVTNIMPQSSFMVSPEKKYINSEPEMFDNVLSDRKLDRRKRRMRRRKKKKPSCNCTAEKTEQECNSEETSPVSVLDFDRQVPGKDLDSPGMGMSPRRKLSTELGNGQHFLLRFDANLMIEQRNIKENDEHKNEARRRKEKQRQRYLDIWEEACKKAGEDVTGSNQVWKHGDSESISEDLGSEIFQYLVNELVDQLLVGQ